MSVVDLTISADTYISKSGAHVNFGNSAFILLGDSGSMKIEQNNGLMRCDLSSYAAKAIHLAQLWFYVCEACVGETDVLYVSRLTQTAWTESGATWEEYDGSTKSWTTAGGDFTTVDECVSEASVGSSIEWRYVDITPLVLDAMANRNCILDIILHTPGDSFQISSSEATTNKPYLAIVYSTAPNAPTLAVTQDNDHVDVGWS